MAQLISFEIWKAAMIGDSGVGKSSFLARIRHGIFSEGIARNNEAHIHIPIRINNCNGGVDILDAGTDALYQADHNREYPITHAFVFVYDITDRTSFENLQKYYDNVLLLKNDTAEVMLIGAKCDLTEKRKILYFEAAELAESWGCPFYETSALLDINTQQVAYQLFQLLRQIPSKDQTDTSAKCSIQ
jgi:small GTP-binding protein